MTEKMRGIEQLHPSNHDLYREVQKLLNKRWQYDKICDHIGLVGVRREKDLVEWFLAYKSPKAVPLVRQKPLEVHPRYAPDRERARRFIEWRKQHEGAAAALRELQSAGITEALSQPQ